MQNGWKLPERFSLPANRMYVFALFRSMRAIEAG
jgi:hypothetical protein